MIAELLRTSGSVTIGRLEEEFGISPMTARRDLETLELAGRARRTHGGGILPTLAAYEDSFQNRLVRAVAEKERLAEAAAALVEPGETLFVDSSTTAYFAVRRIVASGLRVTVLTNSVPVMDLAARASAPHVDLMGIGGLLRPVTQSFAGPQTIRTIESHFADKFLLSVKGLTTANVLTDADPLEADVKRAMIEQSGRSILLLDPGKFQRTGLSVIATVADVQDVLAADAPAGRLDELADVGVRVTAV